VNILCRHRVRRNLLHILRRFSFSCWRLWCRERKKPAFVQPFLVMARSASTFRTAGPSRLRPISVVSCCYHGHLSAAIHKAVKSTHCARLRAGKFGVHRNRDDGIGLAPHPRSPGPARSGPNQGNGHLVARCRSCLRPLYGAFGRCRMGLVSGRGARCSGPKYKSHRQGLGQIVMQHRPRPANVRHHFAHRHGAAGWAKPSRGPTTCIPVQSELPQSRGRRAPMFSPIWGAQRNKGRLGRMLGSASPGFPGGGRAA